MRKPTRYLRLTEEQTRKVQEVMDKSPSRPTRQRAQAILLSSRRYSIDHIADIMEVDRDTVSNWMGRYEREDVEGLADKPKSGRPTTLNEAEQKVALEVLEADPRSLKRVVAEVAEKTGKTVSPWTIKRLAKAANKVWKRVRRRPAIEPDEQVVEESKGELEDLKEKADDGDIALYYFDVAGFSLDPVIPYAWQDRGTTIELPAAHSKRINILAFMDREVEVEACMMEGPIDSHVVVGVFEWLIPRLEQETVVVLDNAPLHWSEEFQDYVPGWKKRGLTLYFLPEYCPELNLIEILWRKIKYEWLPFSAYRSLPALREALMEIFQGLGSKYHISFA